MGKIVGTHHLLAIKCDNPIEFLANCNPSSGPYVLIWYDMTPILISIAQVCPLTTGNVLGIVGHIIIHFTPRTLVIGST